MITVRTLDSERAAKWRAVFGSDELPVIEAVVRPARAPGHPDGALFFHLDMTVVDEAMRERLVAAIAEDFQLDRAEIESDLGEYGVPLLAEGCVLRVDGEVREPEMIVPDIDLRRVAP